MSTLVSIATGNFTSSSSWGVVDSTSYLDSEAASTAIGTSALDSSAFTPGAITIDRICIKLAARAASPSGTFTLTLRNSSAGSDVVSVTVNVSDLPTIGWACINIGSQTLLAATNYLVRVVCSAAGSQVTLYRNGTSNNWTRLLVTTTTAAPASADQLVVIGELTGAGTGNSFTVTMDNTATTSFGPTVSGGPPQGITVNKRGTLTLGGAASTAYYLKWKGIFLVWGEGTINFGTSGSRLPATSSLTLFMDVATNADSSLKRMQDGVLNIYGADKLGKTTLSADEAAAQTVISLTATTGWQNNDQIGFTPTNASTHYERRTIATVDSATQVTISAGLTNAHKGSDDVICTVVNLTRNIKLTSTDNTHRGNLWIIAGGTGAVTIDCLEIIGDLVGTNSTNQRMVDLQLTAATTVTITNCVINPGTEGAGNNNMGLYISGSTANNFDINGFISWRWIRPAITLAAATTGTDWQIRNCVAIGQTELTAAFDINSVLGQVNSNEVWACTGGILFNELSSSWQMTDATRFTGNKCVFCTIGVIIGVLGNGVGIRVMALQNLTTLRNTLGIHIATHIGRFENTNQLSIGDGGSSTQGGAMRFSRSCMMAILKDFVGASETSFVGQQAITLSDTTNNWPVRIFAYNCSFGVASGTRLVYNDATLRISYPNQASFQLFADKCSFGNSVLLTSGTGVPGTNFQADTVHQVVGDHIDASGCLIQCQRYGGTAGDHRTFVAQGTLKTDTAISRTASPSERLTPTTASYKLRSSPLQVPVASGSGFTINVYVRKSASGDVGGADYNGNQPRLILRRNDSMGITADTVIDTMTVAVGNWEQLTGTAIASAPDDGTLEFYVDCDGTAGWINIDDWSVS